MNIKEFILNNPLWAIILAIVAILVLGWLVEFVFKILVLGFVVLGIFGIIKYIGNGRAVKE